MYKNVIVRTPCRALINGISSHPELGKPDYELALKQHAAYVRAMESLGITVRVLPADEAYPDSCFVEDVAVLNESCAVVTNPGAQSRNGEAAGIIPVLKDYYPEKNIHRIVAPGTLEGGDVMQIEKLFYVGISARTNQAGIDQFAQILKPYGYRVIPVALKEVLHLKTGVDYLTDNRLLISGEFITKPEFASYDKTQIPPEENYATNCLWINGTVVYPVGFPLTEALVKRFGYPLLPLDTSEFRKIDGALSCLSLRF